MSKELELLWEAVNDLSHEMADAATEQNIDEVDRLICRIQDKLDEIEVCI